MQPRVYALIQHTVPLQESRVEILRPYALQKSRKDKIEQLLDTCVGLDGIREALYICPEPIHSGVRLAVRMSNVLRDFMVDGGRPCVVMYLESR